jgi:hypothetical protein
MNDKGQEKLDKAVGYLNKDKPTSSPDRMLQFFSYAHLPEHLQHASKIFHDLAEHIVTNFPQNPERTVALRKLLEAKDCAVRSTIYKD